MDTNINNNPCIREIKSREDEVLLQEEFLKALEKAYTAFSVDPVEQYIADNIHYHSFYVFQELHSKTEYMDYLRKKLAAMQNAGRKQEFKMVYQFDGDPFLLVTNATDDSKGHFGFYARCDLQGHIVEIGLMPESMMNIVSGTRVLIKGKIKATSPVITKREMPVSHLPFKDTLIKATYHSDYEYVKQLVESKEFDESIIHDIGLLEKPFPLYYLTLCFKICLAHDFIDQVMPLVRGLRANIDKLLAFWQERFGIDPNEKIDYKEYGSHHFYCTSEEETIEDMFYPDPIQKYLDNGCRMIDIQLYDEVCRFNFDKVEELLKAGANPDANLFPIGGDPNDTYNCLERIGDECSYLCTCEVFPILESEQQRWYLNYALQANDIGDILGWAAHEEMYELLKGYCK